MRLWDRWIDDLGPSGTRLCWRSLIVVRLCKYLFDGYTELINSLWFGTGFEGPLLCLKPVDSEATGQVVGMAVSYDFPSRPWFHTHLVTYHHEPIVGQFAENHDLEWRTDG